MQANQPTSTLVALTPAEFEQLARDVFALVQRDRAEAEIDVVALTGKPLTTSEIAQIRRLLALYFGELAGRAMDEQTAPRPLEPEIMRDWMRQHLRPAA
jgi:hypothetical protein